MGAPVFTNMHLINWYINIKDLIWGIVSKGYLNAFMQSLWDWTTLLWCQHKATITIERRTVMKKTLLAAGGVGKQVLYHVCVFGVKQSGAITWQLPWDCLLQILYITVTFLLPSYVNTSVRKALQVALHILNIQNKTNRPLSNSVDGFVSAHYRLPISKH